MMRYVPAAICRPFGWVLNSYFCGKEISIMIDIILGVTMTLNTKNQKNSSSLKRSCLYYNWNKKGRMVSKENGAIKSAVFIRKSFYSDYENEVNYHWSGNQALVLATNFEKSSISDKRFLKIVQTSLKRKSETSENQNRQSRNLSWSMRPIRSPTAYWSFKFYFCELSAMPQIAYKYLQSSFFLHQFIKRECPH